MTLLIGIAGPKRSGKNTLAAGLSAALGVPEDSFAAPLRRFIADILGITPAQLEQRKEARVDWLSTFADTVTPRSMMQTVGTEWGRRMVHQELWVRSLFERIAPTGDAIISDVRFPNEAEAILERGGMVIRLSRPGHGHGDSHASEIPLPGHLVNVELVNNSTPERLVEAALACIGRPAVGKPAAGKNYVRQDTGD